MGVASRTMSDLYGDLFYERINPGSTRSAQVVLPLVFERFAPKSIVDFGCGSGAWLSVAKNLGVDDVLGVDGPWVEQASLEIPGDLFLRCDLGTDDPELGRRFDMAFSTEVAEHLPPERSSGFVDALCSAADIVVFSAAIPQQGGIGHGNERWQSFWVAEFARNGFGAIDLVRPKVWTDDRVSAWYRQNLIVFVKGTADDFTFIDVVHPYFVTRGLAVPPHPLVRKLKAPLVPVARRVRRAVNRLRR